MVTHTITTAVGGGGQYVEETDQQKIMKNPQSLCKASVYIVKTLLKANNLLNY